MNKRKNRIIRIRGPKMYGCDVDETLIMMDHIPPDIDESKLIKVKNNKKGVWAYAMPHVRHIDLMRKMAARGFKIVVWSAGGEDWAYYIVNKLGIQDLVDVTMGKFDWFADDLPPEQFMKGRIYLDPFNPSHDMRGWVSDMLDLDLDPDEESDIDKNFKKSK